MDQNPAPQHQPSPAPQPIAPVAPPPVNQPSAGSGFAITALVLGIIAFLFGWAGVFNLLTAILAVVFGIVALKKHQSKGMAITGLVLGGIGLLTSLLFALLFGVAFLQGVQESANKELNSSNSSSSSRSNGSSWDLEAVYADIEDGMTKAEVEQVTGKESQTCSSYESATFGKSETCTYGSLFADGGSITVTYNDGVVSSKSKYKS